MPDEKELLILISIKLDNMSHELKVLNNRMDRIEGQTNDLHHYIPFVGWLEEVGQNLSSKFRWLKGYKAPPILLTCENSEEEIN